MGRKKSKSSAYRINLATDHHKKSKEELVDEWVDLIIENEKLKKKLRRYENPHTPPSKDERKSRTNFVSKIGLGVGKRTGYKGATEKEKSQLILSTALTIFVPNVESITSQQTSRKRSTKSFLILSL